MDKMDCLDTKDNKDIEKNIEDNTLDVTMSDENFETVEQNPHYLPPTYDAEEDFRRQTDEGIEDEDFVDWEELQREIIGEDFINDDSFDNDFFDEDDFFPQDSVKESKYLFHESSSSYNKVDDRLLDFIENFVDNQKAVARQKLRLKKIFFWFTMVIFALIVLTPILCLGLLALFKVKDLYVIFGSIAAALLEVLTTVIVLPKIVAEYLFNKEEEKTNLQIVELMQKYSDTMHGYSIHSESIGAEDFDKV